MLNRPRPLSRRTGLVLALAGLAITGLAYAAQATPSPTAADAATPKIDIRLTLTSDGMTSTPRLITALGQRSRIEWGPSPDKVWRLDLTVTRTADGQLQVVTLPSYAGRALGEHTGTLPSGAPFGHRVGGGDRGPRLEEIARWLAIEPLLQHRATQLSAADAFRVALGRALLAHPHALLLDDPLARVPTEARPPLLALLAQLPARQPLPLVLVSPRMDEVIQLADEIVVLHEGRMASAGPAPHILSDVSLSSFLEGEHAGTVLDGVVKRHDVSWLLSEVDVGGQRLTVPAMLHPVGSRVRVKLRARDVALHRHPPSDTSVSNHLRGRVAQIMLAGEHGIYGAVVVELDRAADPSEPTQAPPATLWALLTRKSIQQMGWAPGQPCVVGLKAMAINVFPWR